MQKTVSTWRLRQWAAVITVLCTLIALVLATSATERLAAQSSDERVITVYDGESELTFITKATTVREALKKSQTVLGANDAVEPGLDTQLTASNYHLNVYRARPVLVIDGERRETVISPYKSAKQIVEKAGISLNPEDITKVERVEDVLTDGAAAQKVVVDRAVPIKIELYGMAAEIRTQANTVAELMKEKGVVMGAQDGASYPVEQPIVAGMTVRIWRNGTQTVTQEQPIPMPVRTIRNADKDVGFMEVQTPGKTGKKTVTYEVNMQNGREIGRKEIQSVVTEQPVEQVVVVGTKRKGGDPTSNRVLGKQMMLEAGFGEDQWTCLDKLWTKESGWNQYADNPGSDAYGIPQALPGTKMGPGWQDDPEVQIRWGLGYVKGRYGTPCGAWSAFQAKGWY